MTAHFTDALSNRLNRLVRYLAPCNIEQSVAAPARLASVADRPAADAAASSGPRRVFVDEWGVHWLTFL